MIVMVGAGPRTAAMGVATTTNAHSGSWSRARALECTRGYTGGSSTSGRSKSTQHISVVTTSNFGLNMLPVMVLDGPGHRESTARPLKGPFRYGTAAEKIIRASKGLLTTRGGDPGPAPTRVAAPVAAHGRGASYAIARVSSSTTSFRWCATMRSGPMRDNRCLPRLNELQGCSPRVVVTLGRLQPEWQQL